MSKMSRKDWLIWTIVPLMFAGMIWGIIAIQSSDMRKFRSEGVASSAIVVDKFTTRSSSTDSRDHNFTVTFMAGGDNDEPAEIDLASGEFDIGTIDVGTFSRASFEVGSQSYDDTEIGDTINILYLPTDTDEARLKSQVDNYNPTALWVVVWVLVGTAVFCLLAALFAPQTKNVQLQEA